MIHAPTAHEWCKNSKLLKLPWHWQGHIHADECRFYVPYSVLSVPTGTAPAVLCRKKGQRGAKQSSAVLTVALCHWGKWSIGQRHLWTFTALGVFKSDCLTGAHTTQRGVQNQMLCTSSAGAPSTTPSVTCNGEPKAIPARNAPTQGHGLQTLHCSTQPIRVATASVCSPSLRKEIHFISANLAV